MKFPSRTYPFHLFINLRGAVPLKSVDMLIGAGRTRMRLLLERGIDLVSKLYDMKMRIEQKIIADGLDAKEIRGMIGLRSGKILGLISASSADDPETLAKFRKAAKEVLHIDL